MRRSASFLLVLTACYTHAPVQSTEVVPGMSVRAYVSAAASDRIAPLLGTDARRLAGTVISNAHDTLVVEVPTVARDESSPAVLTLHQRISLARADVLELEARTLNRTRTGALVAGAALFTGSALYKALQGEPGSEKLPGGNETDNLVPLFGWSERR
jgi:hypothetical protein